MSFNVFGDTSNKDIRLGYIDPVRGYVTGISILEANQYGFKNPGTIFILETRDSTRYLTINEVNGLKPGDILPSKNFAQNTCENITGLVPGPDVPDVKEGGGAEGSVIVISGCGGVGAKAAPVVGKDGSLLDIAVTDGGFGYTCPPNVTVLDRNRRGTGAVAVSEIGVSTISTIEYYDQEEDFEEYNFNPDNGPDDISGYGLRFGVDGNIIGGWDPTLYASFAEDPIKIEIQRYQEFLKEFDNPWWHTRKETPISVTFNDKSSRVIHNVTHPEWDNGFMNKYAVSPVPNSNVPGSDYAGRIATMEWEEDFPYTGEYTFRSMGDNLSTVYFDNNKIFATANFRGGPKDILKKTVQAGVHRIKIDLYNTPVKETIRVKPQSSKPANTSDGAEELLISYRGMSSGSGLRRESDTLVRIDDDVAGKFDENARFEIKSSTVNARFSDDGKKILYTGSGKITILMKYRDKQSISGLAITDIEVGGTVWNREFINIPLGRGGSRGFEKRYKESGSVTKTITVQGKERPASKPSQPSSQNQQIGSVFNTIDYISKANRQLWRTNVYTKGGFINDYGICPFPTRETLKDNPYDGEHIILWENVNFPYDGNYNIDVDVDDSVKLYIGNRSGGGAAGIGNGLRSVEEGGDEVIIQKNGFVPGTSKGTGKSTYTRYFKKGKYRIRAELYQKPGGRFGFNTNASSTETSTISASFIRRGGDLFLKVDGSGTADINFSLKVDDNPSFSRLALSGIKIATGRNDTFSLKRTRDSQWNASGKSRFQRGSNYIDRNYREKETITGSYSFEAGRTYQIYVEGQSSTAGLRVVGNGSEVQFDDDANNGFDINASLRISRIDNLQPSPVKGINPMALAINIVPSAVEQTIISPKTFNQNPMGSALTIEAPLPPIPQEPRILSEGRCPENPMWTTRFPGGSQKWWPVTHRRQARRSWSKFMNRYAISPIPPLAIPNTDGGGIVYSNTWNVEIPYSGFYALKGAVDNFGKILVDGDVKIESRGRRNLSNWKAVSPPLTKFFLEKGSHTITVEVENQKTSTSRIVERKVFSTKDWSAPLKKGGGVVDVKFKVTSDAAFANSVEMSGVFQFSKKYKGPQINETTTKKIESGKVYDVTFSSNGKVGGSNKNYPITIQGASSTSGRRVRGNKLEFDDDAGNSFDVNATLKIESTSPGVTAKFNGDGSELIVTGNGDVTLKFSWDDKPSISGLSVGTLKVAGATFRQRGTKGSDTKTVKVSSSRRILAGGAPTKTGSTVGGSGFGPGPQPNIKLRNAGENVVQMEDYKDNDFTDIIVTASKGKFYDFKGNKCKFVVGNVTTGGTDSGTAKQGVTYSGPKLFKHSNKSWSKFMNINNVSPFLGVPFDKLDPNLPGDRTYTWSGVPFPETGRYKFFFQSDDFAKLFINGTLIRDSKSFRGDPRVTYAEITAGKYEVKVVCNNLDFKDGNRFQSNPTGFALKIMRDITITTESKSWDDNPMGISAILIPPPCPKVIEGKGIVTNIVVKQPGNGFVAPPGPGYPTIVNVKNISVDSPGINYSTDDRVLINGIPAPITVDNFGRVTSVNIPSNTNIIITEYPDIQLPSLTGVGFRGTPVNETIIVPEDVFDEDQLIQVTDLVGLKQTGYVNGKPYYGSVFSKDGQLFAGVYETIGKLIPVYATLQESIDAEVVTIPSAILRQGTDISSNDPRLNIPGTPDNLV